MMGMASRNAPPFESGSAGSREKVEGDGPGLVPSPFFLSRRKTRPVLTVFRIANAPRIVSD
jgi:hypothetical protein